MTQTISSAEQIRQYTGPALLSFGFRPFFLAGSIAAAVIPLITALALGGVPVMDFAAGIFAWHGHEMVYGYLSAVIAGFILTAVPNWTGRLPLLGAPLAGLVALWLAGRAAILMTGATGGWPAAFIDASFLFLLDFFLWREVSAGKNWRNAPVCVLIFLLAIGNFIWHFEMIRGSDGVFGLHFGIAAIAVLLALIGGRVTPSFTRNWLAKSGREPINAPFSVLDKLAIAALVVSVTLWLFAPLHMLTGIALLFAGIFHFLRLIRWRGWRTITEPLVFILHIGYFWLVLSIVLLGVSVLAPAALPGAAALHALTAGAMGVMTLAVMTRATLGHTGRMLTADAPTLAIFTLVNLGAAFRVASPFLPAPYASVILISSILWGGAFALFAIHYGRYLLAPRLRGR